MAQPRYRIIDVGWGEDINEIITKIVEATKHEVRIIAQSVSPDGHGLIYTVQIGKD